MEVPKLWVKVPNQHCVQGPNRSKGGLPLIAIDSLLDLLEIRVSQDIASLSVLISVLPVNFLQSCHPVLKIFA